MGRTTRYSSLCREQREAFANKVKQFRDVQGWKDWKLAERYNQIVDECLKKCPSGRYKHIDRSVINRFLNMARPESRSQLRCIRDQDFEIFSTMLSVPISAFTTVVPGNVVVDTPGDLLVAKHFQELLGKHLAHASELLSAAEYLPCSLEDPDFTHWHHKSLFDGIYDDQESCEAVVNEYDEIGKLSRERLDMIGPKRNWVFTHMMVQSQFAEIINPSKHGQYGQCNLEVRVKCLQRLFNLMNNPEMKIRLLLVRDRDAQDLRWLKAWDSLVVVLDAEKRGSFSFWRDHMGVRQRSEDLDIVAQRVSWLEQLRGRGTWQERSEVIEYLKREMTRLQQRQSHPQSRARVNGVL